LTSQLDVLNYFLFTYICAASGIITILGFKYHVITASRWSVLPKHAACVERTNTICCGCQHTRISV